MAVEERVRGGEEEEDQFPIGMRVLAVDDDPICLMLLETLLRRCQYKVTTTSQAIKALGMLRERKDDFDLVISDVHMPDMDGFKLLEHVGLEMDLPVIMLSAHSDRKLVMKGITHGACDYLLKPVRMEELKNIWQHVIRRRSDAKDQKSGDKPQHENDEGELDHKLNKKRKDQMEDKENDSDENEAENEDSKSQKKARVVWSVELHGRFVEAVNQLGLDKAVPKRILELMHVENLTRENVASHLQKFRLYLKRIKTVADQQTLVDGSYLHMGSIDGFGPPRLAGPSHFQNAALRGLPNGGMLRRLNSPTGLGVHDLPSLGAARFNHIQAPGHQTNDQSYFQHNILQGTPISVGLDDDIHHVTPRTRDLPRVAESAITFPVSNGFSGEKIVAGCSNIPFHGGANKPSPLEVRSQMATVDPKIGKPYPFTASWESGISPNYPDGGRCNDNWSGNVQSTGIQLKSFSSRDSFEKAALPRSDFRDGTSTVAVQKMNAPNNVSSIFSLPLRLQDTRVDLPCQVDSIGCNTTQTINYTPQLENYKPDSFSNPAGLRNSTSCGFPIDQRSTQAAQNMSPNELLVRRTGGLSSSGQSSLVDHLSVNLNGVRDLAADAGVRPRNVCTLGQQCLQGNYDGSSGSLEDLVGAMVNQDQAW